VGCVNGPLLRRRLDAIAVDTGRLRRHLASDSYAGFLAWRVAEGLEALDCLLGPTAADVCRANVMFGADETEAVAAALEDVDARTAELQALLGDKGAR
jgi:hypothetical protein